MSALLVVYFMGLVPLIISQWTGPSGIAGLPLADSGQIAGHYNGTIFIIGGRSSGPNKYQLTTYDIASDSFNLVSSSYFSHSNNALGQVYTQQGSILYIIESSTNGISIFDMSESPLTQQATWRGIDATNLDGGACLASTESFLFATGRLLTNSANTKGFRVLDLSTYQWLSNMPLRSKSRLDHGCIVAKNTLYLAAGYYIRSTEYIDISDISNAQPQWQAGPDLTIDIRGVRCATNQDNVFVVGGMVASTAPTQKVHVWNTNTNQMTLLPDWLPQGMGYHALLVVDGVLHAFGGICCTAGGSLTSAHLYYTIGTASPTSPPTLYPTVATTKNPSAPPSPSPSQYPSRTPSYHPTLPPSLYPTNVPSFTPTITTDAPSSDPTTATPSSTPTDIPSYGPTIMPSHVPTDIPSSHPTTATPSYDPTDSPSYEPTYTPTYNPTDDPTYNPTYTPTYVPTYTPTYAPSYVPTYQPTNTDVPTIAPTDEKQAVEDTTGNVVRLVIIIAPVSIIVIVLMRNIWKQRKEGLQAKRDLANMRKQPGSVDNGGGAQPGMGSDEPVEMEAEDVKEEDEEEEGLQEGEGVPKRTLTKGGTTTGGALTIGAATAMGLAMTPQYNTSGVPYAAPYATEWACPQCALINNNVSGICTRCGLPLQATTQGQQTTDGYEATTVEMDDV